MNARFIKPTVKGVHSKVRTVRGSGSRLRFHAQVLHSISMRKFQAQVSGNDNPPKCKVVGAVALEDERTVYQAGCELENKKCRAHSRFMSYTDGYKPVSFPPVSYRLPCVGGGPRAWYSAW